MVVREALTELRSAWWDRRLDNWALWMARDRALGGGSATDGTWGGDLTRPPPPIDGEAFDTERLVSRLSLRLHESVVAHYVWTGTQEECARRLGIHANTLRGRVVEAKEELDVMYWMSRPVHPR